MWKVMMIYPESTQGVKLHRNELVFADGLVHNAEIEVDKSRTYREARIKALRLALKTIKEQGYKSTVIGYGVRSTLSREKDLYWSLLLPQLRERIKAWKKYSRSFGKNTLTGTS